MRARLGLAQCLEDLGRRDEAIGHYQELLRLNPNDNQGSRDILLPLCLLTGRDAEGGALLTQYASNPSAIWKFGWALWTFRQEGDSPAARERLREAVHANRHVPRYLIGSAEMPDRLPDSFAFGSPEEAILSADALAEAWQATPGATDWLRAQATKGGTRKRRRR
jgi:tetratricopeptide (TPR) repeat protein